MEVIDVITAAGGTREKQMITYTIDTENSITARASKQEAGEGESFSSQQELASLIAEWPAKRLIEVWNGIPGLSPVKKFTDRKAAVARIWRAIQSLDGGSPAETAGTAAERGSKAKLGAKQAKKLKSATERPGKSAQGRKSVAKPAVRREGSKKAEVVALLERKGGATLTEIMKATKWQAHSVRGFISRALGKKMGLSVVSVRRDDGERVYAITQ
jgi:hypothetical protein